MKCVHMHVFGRVQGVFFRANVKAKAEELGLKGYAKNMEDGSVEVVAQGENEKLEQLVSFIRKNPGIAQVKDIKINHKETEDFKEFNVM